MTFLEICQAVYMRVGYSGTLASVETTGDQAARLISFVNEAWMEIQGSRTDWKFMARELDAMTSPGISKVLIPSVSKTNGDLIRSVERDSFYCAPPGQGGMRLRYLDEDQRRRSQQVNALMTGKPSVFWGERDGVSVYPIPDKAYRITGSYTIKPQSFASSDTEFNKARSLGEKIPDMPEEYHYAIVWLAVRKIAGFEESANLFYQGDSNYKILFGQMCQSQIPTISWPAPLA